MASLVQGFECEICISYRRNENLQGWLLPVLLLLLATACKKEDPAVLATTYICFPSTIIEPNAMITPFYNEGNKVARINMQQNPYFYSTIFFYNTQNERIDSADFFKTGTLFSGLASVISNGTYTYDAVGRLSTRDSIVMGDLYHTTYHYNPTGQLDTSSQYFVISTTEYLLNVMTYEYPNASTHNPSKITDTSGGSWAYEYDDKPNPARLLGFTSIRSDNNVTKLTVTQGTSTIVYSYSYQYNDNGYPTLMQSGSDETHWVYDCKTVPQ